MVDLNTKKLNLLKEIIRYNLWIKIKIACKSNLNRFQIATVFMEVGRVKT